MSNFDPANFHVSSYVMQHGMCRLFIVTLVIVKSIGVIVA
jgi:hypothetical protein